MQSRVENAAPPSGVQDQRELHNTNRPALPQNPAQTLPRGLNARSCNICRRRKVKCDKQEGGCGNCHKANVECIYPGPGRASRRPKNPKSASDRETELLKRLRRLEGVVEELSGQVELENIKASPASSGDKDSEAGKETKSNGSTVRVVGMDEGSATSRTWLKRLHGMGEGPPRPDLMDKEFGRLVIDEGKSRYVSSSFWASLNGEVDNIRELFEEGSSDAAEEDDESEDPDLSLPFRIDNSDHHNFIMGYSSADVDLRSLHPLPSQIPFYFETFKENVDPLVKIFHLPTMSRTMKEVKDNLGSLSKSTEALCFAIYYATITSMTIEEVETNFGVDKISLLRKYRFGTEQALARARFLNTSEIVTLQAFVLFLICVRRFDDSRFTWTLTGLVIRIAQSLGLHRDGTKFGLSPFDTEMRRRLWWQVAILDVRTAEDYGTDPTIMEQSFDTQLPLNINDADLDPSDTEPPTPIVGVTEMTFCLIRFEICNTSRRLSYIPPADGPCHITFANATLAEKEKLVRDCHERLESLYLVHCEDAGPLFWVAATVARLIIAKMGLIIYLGTPGVADNLPQSIKDRLFIAAIEILEYSRLLETEATTKKWGWLFHTYVQWHAIAYVLNQIGVRPNSELVERAWRAVSNVFKEWDEAMKRSKNSVLWIPMRRLMAKVTLKRERDLAGLTMISPMPTQPSQCPMVGDLPSAPPSISSDEPRLSPIRPLQQGLPQMMSSQGQQVLNQGVESSLSQFYTQQFAPNDVQSQLAVQYEQINNGNPNWTPGMMDTTALDMDVGNLDGGNEMNWDNFDDLVRDFQMEVDASHPAVRGPVVTGMGNWW